LLIRGAGSWFLTEIVFLSSAGWAISMWNETWASIRRTQKTRRRLARSGRAATRSPGRSARRAGIPADPDYRAIDPCSTIFVPSASTIGSFPGASDIDLLPPGSGLLPDLAAAVRVEWGSPCHSVRDIWLRPPAGRAQQNRYVLASMVTPDPTTYRCCRAGLAASQYADIPLVEASDQSLIRANARAIAR